PFLTACSILSLGIETARARSIACRRLKFESGSGPFRAAIMIFLESFANCVARLASCLPLRTAIFAEWEWPAMQNSVESQKSKVECRTRGHGRPATFDFRPR